MEFTGEKTVLAKSAKVFGILGGSIAVTGLTYLIVTRFANVLISAIVGAVTGIAIGITYGCVRFILHGSTPRVVIKDGVLRKEDLKIEKVALARIRKLEKEKKGLVIHHDHGRMLISREIGYPIDDISRQLRRELKMRKS